ncbi:hypothetical protein ACA910_004586 [Epithemia clementina (nom. ined.)]
MRKVSAFLVCLLSDLSRYAIATESKDVTSNASPPQHEESKSSTTNTQEQTNLHELDDAAFWDRFLNGFDLNDYLKNNQINPWEKMSISRDVPTAMPSGHPSASSSPTKALPTTKSPSATPKTEPPTATPVQAPPPSTPTLGPTINPSKQPTATPAQVPPPSAPTLEPTISPTNQPTATPVQTPPPSTPTLGPTINPTKQPTATPVQTPPPSTPTLGPTINPTNQPTATPVQTLPPSTPTLVPTINPTNQPTATPAQTMPPSTPTLGPTSIPTNQPTATPVQTKPPSTPTLGPTINPTNQPTATPVQTLPPSTPTLGPAINPTNQPTATPVQTTPPSTPTSAPTMNPTKQTTAPPVQSPPPSTPALGPTIIPTKQTTAPPVQPPPPSTTPLGPSMGPSMNPTNQPTAPPVQVPPPTTPTVGPTNHPAVSPTTSLPSVVPNESPTKAPISSQTSIPTITTTASPNESPTSRPTNTQESPTANPIEEPPPMPNGATSDSPSGLTSDSPSSPTGPTTSSPSFSGYPTTNPAQTQSPSPPGQIPSPSPGSNVTMPPVSTVSCDVNVTVICENQDNIPCDQIASPNGTCFHVGHGAVEVLSFTYVPFGTCGTSRNQQYETSQCQDIAPLVDEPIDLICVDKFSDLMPVTEKNITIDGKTLFTVLPMGGGSFPPSINCTIISATSGEPLQWTLIDTSGISSLNLKETYGALQVESCDDQVCRQEVFFRNVIDNIASNFMNVTLVNVTIEGRDSQDLLHLVDPNPLAPGESTTVVDVVMVDYCETTNFSYFVVVEADPPNGEQCQDEDKAVFSIEPRCAVDLNLTCFDPDTGLECSQMQSVQFMPCNCLECAKELVFRYTNASCTENREGFVCSQAGMMDPSGGTITVGAGDSLIFTAGFEPGVDIVIRDDVFGGDCLANNLEIALLTNTGNQILNIDTNCTGSKGIRLSDAFGSLAFVGFACNDDQLGLRCSGDVVLTTCATNEGTIDLSVTSFSVGMMGEGPMDLLDQVPSTGLRPGESVCGAGLAEISKCNATIHTAVSAVKGIDALNIGCEDAMDYKFLLLGDNSPPNETPSEPPLQTTGIPSQSPNPSRSPFGTTSPIDLAPSTQAPTLTIAPIESSKPPNAPIASPSQPPSSSRTLFPVINPSRPPSELESPSDRPRSEPPSRSPSSFVTNQPNAPSTVAPTITMPTTTPSERGTGTSCSVNVDVNCEVTTDNTIPCSGLGPPERARCSNGERVNTVSFKYLWDSNCSSSRNQQGDEALCVDTLPLVNAPVQIECFDLIRTPLNVNPVTVNPGESFTVNGDPLVQKINCTISADANILQYNVIDVSGAIELDLKEQYGALELQQCDGLTCHQLLTLRGFIENIGQGPMNVSLVEASINGVTADTLSRIQGVANSLTPLYMLDSGEEAFYSIVDVLVDLCVNGEFSYRLDVEADPPSGSTRCQDTLTQGILIKTPCTVNAELKCTHLKTGEYCNSIPQVTSPDCDCGGSCATELVFRYSPRTCAESPEDSSFAVSDCNQLEDVMPANAQITVIFDSEVQYFAGLVGQDQNIVVAAPNGECLSEPLTVLVQTSVGELVQRFSLAPGCTNDDTRSVGLTNGYGSLDFVGFTCQDGLPNNCFAEVQYEHCVTNDGLVPLTINTFELVLQNGLVSTTGDSSTNDLLPGQSTCLLHQPFEMFVCEATTFTATGTVEANDTANIGCTNSALLQISTNGRQTFPPTSFPTEMSSDYPSVTPSIFPSMSPTTTCELRVSTNCTGCTVNITSLPLCEQRPFLVGMLFRGGNCSENNFTQPIDRVTCSDFPQNGEVPKLGTNGEVYIRANKDPDDGDGDSESPLFEGIVSEGSVYFMYDGGENLPADTQIRIWPSTGPRDSSTILQDVRFHASCSQPLLLKNVFGSHQLVQFENELQGNVSCFSATSTNVRITIPIEALPEGDDILRVFNATIRTNYTDPLVTILEPIVGQLICTEEAARDTNNDCISSFIEVDFETTLTLQDPQGYLQEISILAISEKTGKRCIGRAIEEFFAPLDSV